MGSKKVLKNSPYGPILARKKGESMSSLAKRQTKAFEDFSKKKAKKKR